MSSPAINEALIRDVIEEVMGRLGGSNGSAPAPTPAPAAPAVKTGCGCHSGKHGVFETADHACEAAQAGFEQLREKGIAARKQIIDIVKTVCDDNAREWGRIELEETKIGRLDHKIEKLQIIKLVPGVEWLNPYGLSGDHGITLEEFTPFGVIAAITPSTHSIPTLAGNIVNMIAAGNAVVFNAHPAASQCAAMAIREFNKAIERETGISNIACIIEHPTLDSFNELCANDLVRLLCVTGGPAVVAAAMKSGKRAICAGPGNPPVLVDDTACMDRAASSIIQGGAYDNNLLCIGEKEIFVLDNTFSRFMSAMDRAGAVQLNTAQLDALTQAAFTIEPGQGGGCAQAHTNKDFIGKDAKVLADAAGISIPDGTQLLFAETDSDHPFVVEEQMMPFVPIVRVGGIEEGIQESLKAEHNYKHTSIIHSHDVNHMTAMARALDTTLFVKNGPCGAGLGLGGEGYLSFSIATPTGEGVTNPKTFTRVRRCIMVDNLRIY
ncbi:MAG: aldehyde dehydrogenase EutE [Verrucomicrobiales bacterium]|nr:aldehyde dehydrogenase EutE [Verrucomicrobiales bacterium]